MITRNVTIKNKDGIHAMPATLIVQAAEKYECSIWVEKENVQLNAKSIMNLLTFEMKYNSELVLRADGPGENEAVEELAGLFEKNYNDN